MTKRSSVEQWHCNGHGSAKNKELVLLVISGETQLLALILLTNSHFTRRVASGFKISYFTLKGVSKGFLYFNNFTLSNGAEPGPDLVLVTRTSIFRQIELFSLTHSQFWKYPGFLSASDCVVVSVSWCKHPMVTPAPALRH